MNKNKYKVFITMAILFLFVFSNFTGVSFASSTDEDIANRVLCRFEDGKTLANLRSTDYFYYKFRSKSAITSTEGVNSNWLNKILTLSGFDFNTINESVLGRELNPATIPNGATVNGGPKVSAFDRFGMSGLKWSSYQGEWKFYYVNACYSGQVSPTTYGTYYTGRLEPQSTYNEVSTSKDPRTIQFNKGTMSLIFTALLDIFSNFLFSIAKFIVTLTITFVGLAFTDITTLMGLTSAGGGGTSTVTIFTSLYDTIFKSFVIFAIIFTALYILYNGIIKRQLRLALNTLIRTVIIFVVATIISFNPSYWIGIPNKIATYGQAIILSTMGGIYDSNGAPTLCSTNVGSINENVEFTDNFNETYLTTQMEKANDNMRSLIGCQMWETLLFRPWVRGQFGAEFEDLNNSNLGNVNSEWVGNGTVPLGGGESIDNWALFHLSTQTDAHAQVGDNSFRTVVTGVNADWWRIVDALSNYDEDEVEDSIGGGAFSDRYIDQVSFDTTEYWQTWIGNNAAHRIGTGIMTIAFALAGSIPPLIFSFSSALYGLGITLLMMMSPLFFLFGIWGGKGETIFMGWLSALGNTILKRIGVSILLILSITLTLNIMELVYVVGFVKSFILLIIVSIVLVKNKEMILNNLASINLGGFDPRTRAKELVDKNKRRGSNVLKVGVATTGGAIAGAKTGQGVIKGASSGATSQMRNTLYQSMLGTTIIRELDISIEQKEAIVHNCVVCFASLGLTGSPEVAYRDDNGNYYCVNCAEEVGIEHLYEVVVNTAKDKNKKYIPENLTRTVAATKNRSYLSHKEVKDNMEFKYDKDGKHSWNNDQVVKMIEKNMENLIKDTIVMSNSESQLGKKSRPPSAPQPLHQYIDIALLNLNWTNGNYSAVENTYKEAWKTWYAENAKHIEGITDEDIKNIQKNIDDYTKNISITEKEVQALIENDSADLILKNKEYQDFINNPNKERNLYVYRNGKLVLNNYQQGEE